MIEALSDLRIDRVKGRGFFAEPLHWSIEGVIAPVHTGGWREEHFGLICSKSGIIAARRDGSGFWQAAVSAGFGGSPAYSPDDAYDLSSRISGQAVAYSRGELRKVTLSRRMTKNAVDLRLVNGSEFRYYVCARDSTDEYEELLRRTYGPVYREQKLGWWRFLVR
jgi:hypothetical protein